MCAIILILGIYTKPLSCRCCFRYAVSLPRNERYYIRLSRIEVVQQKAYSVPNGHKHPIGTGDTLLEYKKDKPKNQILFFSAISFTLVLVPVTFTILTLCADFPQSVADFHKSKTRKILSIPKCWVGRFRSELVKSNAPIVPPF